MCGCGCMCSCSSLSSSLLRSCFVTTQPCQNNMDTTVAEWPFWVKALCNNKQLLALRSCFPAADRCQNTELTAIPFTAVEKHQPSKPTYSTYRGFEQLVIPQQLDGSQKHASSVCCQRNYCAVIVLRACILIHFTQLEGVLQGTEKVIS